MILYSSSYGERAAFIPIENAIQNKLDRMERGVIQICKRKNKRG